MLLKKCIIKPSTIQGIGLFADEFIKKHELIWKWEEGLDGRIRVSKVFEPSFERMPRCPAKDYIWKMAFPYKTYSTNGGIIGSEGHTLWYYWANDYMTYINHSESPNTYGGGSALTCYASRDILKGEELTQDYTSDLVYEIKFDIKGNLSSYEDYKD